MMSFRFFYKTNDHFLIENYFAGKPDQLLLTLMFKIIRIYNSYVESKSSLLGSSFSLFTPHSSLCELH